MLGLALIGGAAACTKPTAVPTTSGDAVPSAGDDAHAAPVAASGESGRAVEVPQVGLREPPEAPAGVEPAEVEPAEVEWVESPLEADLDGDGKPETIAWSCGGKLSLRVGRARVREAYRLSEEMGCTAAVVALRPGEAARQLVVTIDEHEEVGPDLHFFYAYRGGKLEPLWSEKASVEVLVDGSWVTETSDCFDGTVCDGDPACVEAPGELVTTIGRHRWDGAAVTSEAHEERMAVSPGGCAEP